MAMQAAQGATLVPERFRRNRFTSAAWYAIHNVWTTKGVWIDYKKYQQIAVGPDKQCHQSVFEDVLREMQLEETLHPRDKFEIDENAPDPVIPPPHVLHQKESSSKLQDALIKGLQKNGTAKSAEEKPSYTFSTLQYEKAKAWIQSHLDEGYPAFKAGYPEVQLDFSWWTKTRNLLLHPSIEPVEPENMPAEPIKFDPRVTSAVRKVTTYLLSLGSAQKIEQMDRSEYHSKSKHDVNWNEFRRGKKMALRHVAGYKGPKKGNERKPYGSRKAAIQSSRAIELAPPRRTASNRSSGKQIDILAQVEIAAFSTIDQKKLHDFAKTIAEALVPDRDITVVMLAYPPSLEIRAGA